MPVWCRCVCRVSRSLQMIFLPPIVHFHYHHYTSLHSHSLLSSSPFILLLTYNPLFQVGQLPLDHRLSQLSILHLSLTFLHFTLLLSPAHPDRQDDLCPLAFVRHLLSPTTDHQQHFQTVLLMPWRLPLVPLWAAWTSRARV